MSNAQLAGYTLPNMTDYSVGLVPDGLRRRSISGTFHFRRFNSSRPSRRVWRLTFDALNETQRNTVLAAWNAAIDSATTYVDIDGASYSVVASRRLDVEVRPGGYYRVVMELEEA